MHNNKKTPNKQKVALGNKNIQNTLKTKTKPKSGVLSTSIRTVLFLCVCAYVLMTVYNNFYNNYLWYTVGLHY